MHIARASYRNQEPRALYKTDNHVYGLEILHEEGHGDLLEFSTRIPHAAMSRFVIKQSQIPPTSLILLQKRRSSEPASVSSRGCLPAPPVGYKRRRYNSKFVNTSHMATGFPAPPRAHGA